MLPSVTQNSDTSGPSRYSSIDHAFAGGGVRERRVAVAGDDHALAGGQPVVLDDVGRAELVERRRGLVRRRADARRARSARPAAAMTSFAKALLPSSRAAAADGPKQAMPAARTASATPATSGASGPTTTRSAATLAGQLRDGSAGRCAVDATLLGDRGGAGVARRAHQRGHRRVGGKREAERVLAGSGAEDEDAHAREPT